MKKALQKHENKANAKLVCFLRNIVYVIVWEGLRALPKHLKYKREGTETLPYVFGYWMLDAEGINAFRNRGVKRQGEPTLQNIIIFRL